MDIKDLQIAGITAANLYRMESYTDQTAGTIFRQIPVLESGERDLMRQEAFGGSCTILVRGQPMPINFPIEGTTLVEAIENFPTAVKTCLQEMHDQAVRSKILTPGSPGNGLSGGPVGLKDLKRPLKQ